MERENILTCCSEGINVAKKASQLLFNNSSDSPFNGFSTQLQSLKERFSKQELIILVAGEVSSGKSTFLNTLIGTDVLSVARETCTNVPTKISYGKDEKYIVHFADDVDGNIRPALEINKDEVCKYTSESVNPKNSLGVAFLEITINNKLLADGLSFIDTPGLGAIDPLHAIATYNIATQADIIFFLGDTSKPLTSVEVITLKNLIKVSDANHIAHLVTQSDKGDPQTILNENKQILDKEFDSVDIDYFMVSSKKYRDYLVSDDRYDLEDSGFREIHSYINQINTDLSAMLSRRFNDLVLQVCKKMHDNLQSLYQSTDDPNVQEERLEELKTISNRLKEIKNNWNTWNVKLIEQQKLFASEIQQFITNSKMAMINNVEEMLKDSAYLKDKESLAKSITADMVKFQKDLSSEFIAGYTRIYIWLRKITGFSEIQEKIGSPEFNSTNFHIDENVGNISLGHKVRNIAISSGIGGTAATAGAKVGALIGSSIAPGPGTLIGAAIGGIAGAITGFLVHSGLSKDQKERQRKEIQNACNNQINQYFINVSGKISLADIPNSTDLGIEFKNQLEKEQETCKIRLKNIADLTLRLRTNYDAVKKLTEQSGELVNQLSKK